MSSKLENLKSQLKSALTRFEEVLQVQKTPITRDSAIQRFEFTYGAIWLAFFI